MRLTWTDQAKRDLRDKITYIARRNPTATRRMRDRVQHGVRVLRTQPSIGRPGDLEDTRELVISGTPYLVVYGVTGEEVTIYHVHDGRQNWKRQSMPDEADD
jgi:addiction module RelE/StbE family toxin